MATSSNSQRRTVVPQEIIGIICQDAVLTTCDLHILCSVSHAFLKEAERILYHSVELDNRVKLMSFCIVLERRPSLARCIRKLVLHIKPELNVDRGDLARIAKMLHLATNLRDLCVLGCYLTYCANPTQETQEWILEGHEFKLTTFASSFFRQTCFKEFLESQPKIETLLLTRYIGTRVLHDALIPNLKNLSCDTMTIQELIRSNSVINLERLQISVRNYSHSQEAFFQRMKTRIAGKLKSLSVLRNWDISALVPGIAAHYPAIKFLEIQGFERTRNVTNIFPFNAKFTHIETLVIHAHNFPPEHQDCFWSEVETDAGRLAIAKRTMESLPTLKRFVLVMSGQCMYEYTRTSSPGLGFSVAHGVSLDADEWLKVEA